MSNTLVNRRDLAFNLYEVLDAEKLTEFSYYEDHSKETFDMALDTAYQLAQNLFWEHYQAMDKAECYVDENGQAVVEVTDTGIGIPADVQSRVFERFYRVDRARSREKGGTGLCLAIVKHAAQLHGGRVDVSSRLGEGSTFRVSLPLS